MAESTQTSHCRGFLTDLARDKAGNTLALIAAGLFPLLALVGGAIDMGRSYLSQTRLQQACDSGVLAARRKLGSAVAVDGLIPADVASTGSSFFNMNFGIGAYGTENRSFQMTLESDYAISGEATVDVPTTIMTLFGYDNMPIKVACEARLNFANTDVMFVLDTTGSMDETNPADTDSRIEILRSTVRKFYDQLEASKSAGNRIRYGFLPYSTNVNVGGLLQNDWVVNQWTYQSREAGGGSVTGTDTDTVNWIKISGDRSESLVETYTAVWMPPTSETAWGYWSCNRSYTDSYDGNYVELSSTSEPFAGPPAGTKTTTHYQVTYTGGYYSQSLAGSTCTVKLISFNNEVWEYDEVVTPEYEDADWRYAPISRAVGNWRAESNGCIEERSTYEIDDWDNVDFSRALDLDIDLVPSPGDPDTQWRPQYPDIIYERELHYYGWGDFTVPEVIDDDDFFQPGPMGYAACPTEARKLAEISGDELTAYLNSLQPFGSTYHDIGMIWGARMISPKGIFADENADVDGKPTSRNIIFLTDGITSPLDISYGTYGVEPLDRRRWSPDSAMSLTQVIEGRFGVACAEAKKRNISVWVIGFGIELNPFMTECAGAGHAFEASSADELTEVFDKIASQLGNLRISK